MAILKDQPKGTYLVRVSYTDPKGSPFTISLPEGSNIRIFRASSGLAVNFGDVVCSVYFAFIHAQPLHRSNAQRGTCTSCYHN